MSASSVGRGGDQARARADKEMDAAVTSVLSKVHGVKSSLSTIVGKIEQDQSLTWPSVLDSFTAISGHVSTLMKQLGNEKLPPMQSRVVLPLQVSSDRDEALEKSTEGRIPILHHEIIPNYLRTKLDLDLEAEQRELKEAAKLMEKEGERENSKKKIAVFNETIQAALERVNEAREEQEEQRPRGQGGMQHQPNTTTETRKLVAAYLHGTGLKPLSPNRMLILAGVKRRDPQAFKARSAAASSSHVTGATEQRNLPPVNPYSIPVPGGGGGGGHMPNVPIPLASVPGMHHPPPMQQQHHHHQHMPIPQGVHPMLPSGHALHQHHHHSMQQQQQQQQPMGPGLGMGGPPQAYHIRNR